MTDSTALMARRIRRILLICNSYDAFALEEDGYLNTQIKNEYAELSLSNPPEICRIETTTEALNLLESGQRFDLILTMYNVGEIGVFDFSRKAKQYDNDTPVVLLASYSREVYRKIEKQKDNGIDYFFCWNGSTDLIIAIIKLLEDRINADSDILESGVQAILLVEDNIRYYSTYLPALYKIILQQNIKSIEDALNEDQQYMRKRSRPKILMATNYDDAIGLYTKYRTNLLGVISDVGFVVHSGDDSSAEKIDAGVDLCRYVKKDSPRMAYLMQSSQESMRQTAAELGVGFLNKSSNTLLQELGEYLEREFGFGDFVVFDPDTNVEIARAQDLFEFEHLLSTIPDKAFLKLSENNYLSKWLYARGLFDAGREISRIRSENYENVSTHRAHDIKVIHSYRMAQAVGVVAAFNPEKYNDAISFARLGSGSIGGKGRGLAFLNHTIVKHSLYDRWKDTRVFVPRTLVISTDFFDRFIKDNGLKYVINSDVSDSELLSEFVASPLPKELRESLKAFLKVVRKPLAIRSSSRLEDSYHQPFAGVYSTYMIPGAENDDQRLRMVTKAITSVYASAYYSAARNYILASGNVVSEEKMAIVIQELCGSEEGEYFLPTASGVARSVNFYPVGHEKAEDGIVKMAYGLGKAVVDGGRVLRFSPAQRGNIIQTSTPELVMNETQNEIFAMSLRPDKFMTSTDDGINIAKLNLSDCRNFKSFRRVVSTWDKDNMRIVDSAIPEGPKFITFAQMLKFGTCPVSEIVSTMLEIARNEMKCEIEMEFAVDFDKEGTALFNILQVRPISVDTRHVEVDWKKIDSSAAILTSRCALGTGWINGVKDLVYVKPESWNVLKTRQIAQDVASINSRMRKENKGYALIGFGRWGTSEDSLGIPVVWSDISEAKVLVESSLKNFQVEPSQGTHFFQNLTSFNVGYINVNPFQNKEDMIDFNALNEMEATFETDFIRCITFKEEMRICIDGKNSRALLKIQE